MVEKDRKPTIKDSEIKLNGVAKLVVNDSPITVELSDGRIAPSVGFLGPRGTYTERAKEQLLGTDGLNTVTDNPLSIRNKAVVERVASGEFDLGVVAAENSTEGDVNETLRTLINTDGKTQILAETIIPIRHALIGHIGQQITEIRSHMQALGQSNDFLEKNYPRVKRVEVSSTSIAASEAKGAKHIAAIGDRRAAEINGLAILADNIGDNPHNATRFFLIGRGETEPTGNDTTTLVFSPSIEKPGILVTSLAIFSDRGINLTKIASHPVPHGKIDQHIFYVSFDGHTKDKEVAEALDVLRTDCKVKILGSYKKADLPEGAYEPGTWNGD